VHKEQRYYIEDISSYHIHAGDYFLKKPPRGGHSNHGGNKLNCFNPIITKHGSCETKDLLFRNSRFADEIKDSTVYSEAWSEYFCDLKAIEAMMSDKAEFEIDSIKNIINIKGNTLEGLKIHISYDIKAKRITTHYPRFDQ